jgi:O-antigen/teichoic acid export membrane protein
MLNLVLSFVSRTIFLQILGVGYLGINGLFSDVLSMLNMAELGIGTAMTYSMYKPLAENDQETLAGLTHFYKQVYRIIAFVIAAIGVSLVPFLPYLVNLEKDIPHVEIYYLLFLAGNVASYFVVAKTTVLYADQKNYLILQHGAVWHTTEVLTMLLVLWLTKNYTLYLLTQLVFVYGRNFYMSHLATKYYPYLKQKIKLPKEKTKSIFKDIGSSFLYKIANVLITATDNTLISVLVSTEMVGYYSNYYIIVGKLSNLIGTLFTSLIASLGNLIAKESEEKRYQVFQTMQSLSLIISTFCVTCLALLEDDFIRVWLGNAYVLSPLTLVAIVINFYFVIATKPVTAFREAAGLFRKTKYIMLWTAILNIGFSIVLGWILGLPGILLATSFSKLLTYFWYEPKLLFQDYFSKPCRLYFYQMAKNALITITSIIAAWFVTQWFVPQNWLQLIGKGTMVSMASLIVIIVCYHKTQGYILLAEKCKSMLRSLITRVRRKK